MVLAGALALLTWWVAAWWWIRRKLLWIGCGHLHLQYLEMENASIAFCNSNPCNSLHSRSFQIDPNGLLLSFDECTGRNSWLELWVFTCFHFDWLFWEKVRRSIFFLQLPEIQCFLYVLVVQSVATVAPLVCWPKVMTQVPAESYAQLRDASWCINILKQAYEMKGCFQMVLDWMCVSFMFSHVLPKCSRVSALQKQSKWRCVLVQGVSKKLVL